MNTDHSETPNYFWFFALFFAVAALLLALGGCFYTIGPTERGVQVTLGKMSDTVLKPGFGYKMPFITTISRINVQQATSEANAECFSSDLQQVKIRVKILYSIPEKSVILILRDYAGDPFDALIVPRVQEALKEVTASKTAADIVKTREEVKIASLTGARNKIGDILLVKDLVIEDVGLSTELEHAIEQKMVQQQEAEKSIFKKEQAQTDAETAIIMAKGQAEAIRIQGEALEKNPKLIELKMVEKWNGVTPQVVGSGSNILLPMNNQK